MHRTRFILGRGHSVLNAKGETVATFDDKDEAETHKDKLNEMKEHQKPEGKEK
jgi:hypothetical protein